LACKAPVSSRMLRNSREPARSHMRANGSELGSCKSWSCQARQQGLCRGPKLPDDKQGSLGIASQPATGQDAELRDSNSARGESHAKLRREFCWVRCLESDSVFVVVEPRRILKCPGHAWWQPRVLSQLGRLEGFVAACRQLDGASESRHGST
jgi:hypothetical protein